MNKLLIQIAAATLFLNYAAAFAQQPAATEEGQVQVNYLSCLLQNGASNFKESTL